MKARITIDVDLNYVFEDVFKSSKWGSLKTLVELTVLDALDDFEFDRCEGDSEAYAQKKVDSGLAFESYEDLVTKIRARFLLGRAIRENGTFTVTKED